MKNPAISLFVSPIICLTVLFMFSSTMLAQEYDIYELAKINSAEKTTEKIKKSNGRAEFYNLYQNLHPTIYLEDNAIKKIYGNGAITRLTLMDAASINALKSNKNKFNDVRLVTIKLKSISELNNSVTLNPSNGFNKLEYVFIKCYFKYTEEDLKDFVKVNPNVRVFHISANPS